MGEEVFIQHLYWVAGGVKQQLEGDRIYWATLEGMFRNVLPFKNI